MNKIYLSPSVQEDNKGAGNYGTEEAVMNLIADVAEKALKKNNQFEVFRNNREWGLAQIVNDSNAKGVDIHVAIHSNASSLGNARGCEVFAYSKESNGSKLAELIYNRISVITPSADRGVRYDPTLYELANTNAPAVLAEIAFHDNLEDANWIINNIEKIGVEIAKAIYEYFGVAFNEVKPEPKQDDAYTTFVKGVQSATGAVVDGDAGQETISKTITVSQHINDMHPVVRVLQTYLNALGYDCGAVDGEAGPLFDRAVKAFQKANGCVVDGEITARNLTWKKLLKLA